MELAEMISFVRGVGAGVVATVAENGEPQAAYLDLAASDTGELVFNARADSRKITNIGHDGRVAVVVGGTEGTTLQGEGIARVFGGGDGEGAEGDFARCAAAYAAAFPQFQAVRPDEGVVLVSVQLSWARFRDYRGSMLVSSDVELGSARSE